MEKSKFKRFVPTLWSIFIVVIIFGLSIAYMVTQVGDVLRQNNSEDIEFYAAIFPPLMGFIGGLLLGVKIITQIVITKKQMKALNSETKPLIKEISTVVQVEAPVKQVLVHNPQRVMQEIKNLPKGILLVTFLNGIE